MKKLVLLLVAVVAASCSSDDSTSEKPKQLLSKVTVTENAGTPQTYNLNYNEKNQVESVVKIGVQETTTYTYTYNNDNQVVDIHSSGAASAYVLFQYDSSKHLSSIVYNDVVNPVIYSADTKTYALLGTSLTLNSDGDLAGYSNLKVVYDTENKGPFYGTKGNFQFINILLDIHFLMMANQKPIKDLTLPAGDDTDYTLTNTFDDNGYVTELQYKIEGQNTAPTVYQYEYKTL